MKMYAIPYSPPLASLLDTFKNWDGVVDYVLIGWDENTSDSYELHKEAAIFTAKTLIDRHTSHLNAHLQETKQSIDQLYELPIGDRKGIQIRPDEAKGQQISVDEFFAPKEMWVSRADIHKYPFLSNNRPILALLDKNSREGIYIVTGRYRHAFSEPPYGLSRREEPRQVSQAEIDELFDAINKQLFGESLNNIVIYKWSTDWIDYLCFHKGYDWWGSYLWTIYNMETGELVGITASATD